jgi:hypothetical protein
MPVCVETDPPVQLGLELEEFIEHAMPPARSAGLAGVGFVRGAPVTLAKHRPGRAPQNR